MSATRRVLLAGTRGQLGSALQTSAPTDVELTALDHAQLDIGDLKQVREVVARCRPQLILNAAAYTAVDQAEAERGLAFRINAEGPGHLAQAAQEHGARLIHVSTDYVFDGMKATPYQPGDAPNPLSVYGESKLAGEHAVAQRCERALVLRTAWVHAATGRNFVNTMRRLLAERDELRVVDDQFGTPTHAASLARAIWRYAALPDERGIQHWTDGGGPISWFDFARQIRENLAAAPAAKLARLVPIPTGAYPTPARRPLRAVLDISGSMARVGAPAPWQEELAAAMGTAR